MKIILTIILLLVALGGGAYYAQNSGLYDFSELKQYIPSQVKEYLNMEDEETLAISADDLEEVNTPMTTSTPAPATMPAQMAGQQQQQITDQAADTSSDSVSDNSSTDNTPSNHAAENSLAINKTPASSEISHNDREALVNNEENTKTAEKNSQVADTQATDVQVLDASPEEMEMVKELNKIESKIASLDNENEALQLRYRQMIKKNRELALKIREIDHQIEAMNGK